MQSRTAALVLVLLTSTACGGTDGDSPGGESGSGGKAGGASGSGGSALAGANAGGSSAGSAAGPAGGTSGGGGATTLGEPFVPKRLGSGNAQNCVVTQEQDLYCWGSGPTGGSAKYVQVSHQTEHHCALDTTGKIDCFESSPLQSAIPSGTFSEVRVAVHGACAKDMQGMLTCWTDGNESAAKLVSDAPSEAVESFYVSLDTGCAVLASGGNTCWGFDSDNSLRTMPPRNDFVVFGGSVPIVGIAPDHSLVAFGLGFPPDVPPGNDYVQVAVGDDHVVGLHADGSVSSVGTDAVAAPAGVKFVEVSAGDGQTCGITSSGSVQCWGNDTSAWFKSPPDTVRAF